MYQKNTNFASANSVIFGAMNSLFATYHNDCNFSINWEVSAFTPPCNRANNQLVSYCFANYIGITAFHER